jgi:hypothetical protein
VLRTSAVIAIWLVDNVSWLSFVDKELRILHKRHVMVLFKKLTHHKNSLQL